MKARNVVKQIADSPAYQTLKALWERMESDVRCFGPDDVNLTVKVILQIEEQVAKWRKIFFSQVSESYRPKDVPLNKVYTGAVKNAEAALDAFDKQIREQLPVYQKVRQRVRKNLVRTVG